MTIVAQTAIDPLDMVDQLRRAVWEVDDGVALETFRTIEQIVSDSIAVPRSRAILLGAFAVTGVLLAVAGVFAVSSFVATTRTREIGIRMALGSNRRGVVRLFMADSMKWLAAGLAGGLGLSAFLVRYLEGYLFETPAFDPVVLGATCLLLMCAVVVGAARPAFRAASVDPVEVLQDE